MELKERLCVENHRLVALILPAGHYQARGLRFVIQLIGCIKRHGTLLTGHEADTPIRRHIRCL